MIRTLPLLVFILLFVKPSFIASQEQDPGKYPIVWQNGNITYLKDLGKVSIELKNGKKIHKAIIRRINEEREVLEYEKNNTMHDLHFRDFKSAHAGNNSINIIYLTMEHKISVKTNPDLYYDSEKQNFKVSCNAAPKQQSTFKPATDSVITIKQAAFGSCDTLIKSNEIIPIRVIEMNSDLLRYKRRDIEDGPLYIISRKPETQVCQYSNYVKIYLNN